MLRDFSDEVKQKLYEAVDAAQAEREGWWIFNDIIEGLSDLFIDGNISHYHDDIEEYHRKIIDKKDTSRDQLDQIWTQVYQVDLDSIKTVTKELDNLDHLIRTFTNVGKSLDASPASDGLPLLALTVDEYAHHLIDTTEEDAEVLVLEQIYDHEMQDEIFAILAEDRFSHVNWDAASQSDKQQLLGHLFTEVNRIMGTNVDPNINYVNLGSTARGTYNSGSNQLTINTDYFSNTDSYMLLRTVVHEVRHAYQHESVVNPSAHPVSQETRAHWENNFLPGNYRTTQNDGYESYVTQPVEFDAKSFAGQIQDIVGYTPDYAGSWEERN
jgi:hypothetical protein